MKIRLITFVSLLTLGLFVMVTGCIRGDNYAYIYGDVTFWNNDPRLSNIVVTVDNRMTSTIRVVGEPYYCNEINYANFYLQEGYHDYYAKTVDGLFLERGSFYVSNACKIIYIP